MEGNGHPKTVEGLAWRLDHEGCLYCATIRSEVREVKKDLERLQNGISKGIWLVAGALVASALTLANTVISAMAAKP